MSKMDELRRKAGGNVAESMGVGLDAPHRRRIPPASARVRPPPSLQGVTRSKRRERRRRSDRRRPQPTARGVRRGKLATPR